MSNYTQTTFFAPKDITHSVILGAQFDPEFAAISTAIATKYDTNTTTITLSGAFTAGSITTAGALSAGSQVIGSPTGGNQGAGTLNVAGNIYINGVAIPGAGTNVGSILAVSNNNAVTYTSTTTLTNDSSLVIGNGTNGTLAANAVYRVELYVGYGCAGTTAGIKCNLSLTGTGTPNINNGFWLSPGANSPAGTAYTPGYQDATVAYFASPSNVNLTNQNLSFIGLLQTGTDTTTKIQVQFAQYTSNAAGTGVSYRYMVLTRVK